MLATRAAGPVDLHLDVRRVQLHVHPFRLRQHGHRGGGGLDAAIGLRHRHPLDPVDAALEFQPGPGALALDEDAALLHAPQLRLVQLHGVSPPAPGGSVHGVHPQQRRGEQRRLLAAGTRPDLQDHVLPVIGILGQQQELQLLP